MGASKVALILMKNSHFDRTPQYYQSISEVLKRFYSDVLEIFLVLSIRSRSNGFQIDRKIEGKRPHSIYFYGKTEAGLQH